MACVVTGLWLIPRRPIERPRTVVPTHPKPASSASEFETALKSAETGDRRALRAVDPYHLESAFLNRNRPGGARSVLLTEIEARGDAASKAFISDVLHDATEEMGQRLVALLLVARRRDDEGCALIRSIWGEDRSWPATQRYHLIHALGENGRPAGMPVVQDAAGPRTVVDIRGHAVQALGAWASDASVREHLRKVATTDGVPLIRVNALTALAKSSEKEVDEFLSAQAVGNGEVARAAQELLRRRQK